MGKRGVWEKKLGRGEDPLSPRRRLKTRVEEREEGYEEIEGKNPSVSVPDVCGGWVGGPVSCLSRWEWSDSRGGEGGTGPFSGRPCHLKTGRSDLLVLLNKGDFRGFDIGPYITLPSPTSI